jgi:chemoreceptor zinc-binding protein
MQFRAQITKAIGAHSHWKQALMSAIESGSPKLSLDQVGREDACEVGQWFNGAEIPEAQRKTPEFEACREVHAEFHKAAAEVLRLAISGDKRAAVAALGADSRFAKLSSALTLRMMQWAASRH